MIFRKYGKSYHEVVPNFDSRAMTEVGFQKTGSDAIEVGEFESKYERVEGRWRTVHQPGVYAPSHVPPVPGDAWLACGNGFQVYRDVLLQRHEGKLAEVAADVRSRAQEIVRLAVPCFERGEGRDAASAAPLYVRDKVALKTHEQK